MSSVPASARNRGRRWIFVSTAVAGVGAALVAILLVSNWPFTQAVVTKTLENRFAREVKIRNFRSTYFPPGFVAEGIDFLPRKRKDLPPLISVETLTLRGSYTGLLRIHTLVNDVQLAGLHVRVPPQNPDASHQTFPLTNSTSGRALTIGEITTDGAVVEFLSNQPAEDRFILQIDHLTLDDVGDNGPVAFHARLQQPSASGESAQTDGLALERRRSSQHRTFKRVQALMGTLTLGGSKASTGPYPHKENSAARLAISMPKERRRT